MELKHNKFLKYFLFFLGFLVFGGVLSCSFRFWPDFDFSSYHYYNGWAFLNDRLGSDFLAASFRSYFNPILDSLTYLLINSLNTHPLLFLFITGFKYGIFMFLCWFLFDIVFKDNENKLITVIFSLLLAFLSPIALLTIGFDWVDLQIAGINLIACCLFLANIFSPASKKRLWLLFLSGLVLGLAVGLKYYVCVFSIAFLICILIKRKNIEQALKVSLIMLGGMFVGFLITDGYWIITLWQHFANPMFPYMNNIFHSPMGSTSPVVDYDFSHIRPTSLWGLITLPLWNTVIPNISLEYSFYDLKLPLTFLVVLGYLILRIKKSDINEKIINIINPDILDLCVIITVFAYYLNTSVFALVRYLLALIPFACILIAVFAYFVSFFIRQNKITVSIIALIVIASIVSHFLLAKFYGLEAISLILFVSAIGLLFYVYSSKNISDNNKQYFISLLLIVCCFIGVTRCVEQNSTENYNLEKIMSIEHTSISNGSTVLCATMTACFVAPAQNKKAKYISYALQKDLQNERNMLDEGRFATLTEYNSDYLENKMREIFQNERNIYMIFSYQDMVDYFDEIRSIYQKSVSEYSDNTIENIYENCRFIDYALYTYDNIYGKYEICKIK